MCNRGESESKNSCIVYGLNLKRKINGRVEELLFELSLLVDETAKEHPYIRDIDVQFEGGWSSELASLKLLV